jgi:type I restriction enzyme S subunit
VVREGQFIISKIDARNGACGIIPRELDGALVSIDFPVFNILENRLNPSYLAWLCRTAPFIEECKRASEGTTNRVRLQEEKFLRTEISLPSVSEQRRIVASVDSLKNQIDAVLKLRQDEERDISGMLLGAFRRISDRAPMQPMRHVAPIVRRPIVVEAITHYPEIGIRSFGKGTFHKPSLSGLEIGTKRIFQIEPGDLLFSNVFLRGKVQSQLLR